MDHPAGGIIPNFAGYNSDDEHIMHAEHVGQLTVNELQRPLAVRTVKGNKRVFYQPISRMMSANRQRFNRDEWRKRDNKTVLTFKNQATHDNLCWSAGATTAHWNYLTLNEEWMEASKVALYLVRHGVIILDGEQSRQKQRKNLYLSFNEDVVGKWCQPTGDLLVLPTISEGNHQCRITLNDVTIAMDTIAHLHGKFKSHVTQTVEPVERGGSSSFTLLKLGSDFAITGGVDTIRNSFKPVFCEVYFHIKSPKSMMTVEVLQAAILLIHSLTYEALRNKDYGEALYLTLNARLCRNYLSWILGPSNLFSRSYTHTMTSWYTARCYMEIYNNWSQYDDIAQRFIELHPNFELFRKYVYHPIEIQWSKLDLCTSRGNVIAFLHLPHSELDCVQRALYNYRTIGVPRRWKRSYYEKCHLELLSVFFELREFAEDMRSDGFLHITMKKFDLQIIHKEIISLRGDKRNSSDREIFLLNCGAMCAKMKAMCSVSEVLNTSSLQPAVINGIALDVDSLAYRSYVQKLALTMMNNTLSTRSRKSVAPTDTRAVAILMAKKTLFDEIFYSMDMQKYISGSLFRVTSLLPSLLDIWFSKKTLSSPMPREEKEHFDQLLGMFYYGAAIMNLTAESSDAQLNNCRYFFTVACIYIKRRTVAHNIIKAFRDEARMFECSLISYESLQNNDLQRCFYVLRKLVYLLPILHELCITNSVLDRVAELENRIKSLQYPVSLENLGDLDYSNQHYNWILEILKNDLNLRTSKTPSSIMFSFEAQDVDKSWICFEDRYRRSEEKKPLPYFQGVDNCKYTQCPLEEFHILEETKFNAPHFFHAEIYSSIFSYCRSGDPEESQVDLLVYLEGCLKKMIRATKDTIELKYSITQDQVTFVAFSSYLPCHKQMIKISKLKEQLNCAELFLDIGGEESAMLLRITKALYQLDSLFNSGILGRILHDELN